MNIKADKMRYQTNTSAFSLILLGLVLSVAALFSIITPSTIVPDFTTALEILINIILMLVTFLAAERCKFYDRKWAIAVIFIAAIHILRIFFVPTRLVANDMITASQYIKIILLLVGSAVALIFGAIITLRKHHVLSQHMKEMGE